MSHVFGSTWLKCNVKTIRVNGSVQTKPVQSKTTSLYGSVQSDLPIRPDGTEPYRGPGSSRLVESLRQMVVDEVDESRRDR